MPKKNVEEGLRAYTRETIAVDDTAGGKALDTSKVLATPPPRRVVMKFEDGPIRYTVDGTTVTSTLGELINPIIQDPLILYNRTDMRNFRAIRTTSTSGEINAVYYR